MDDSNESRRAANPVLERYAHARTSPITLEPFDETPLYSVILGQAIVAEIIAIYQPQTDARGFIVYVTQTDDWIDDIRDKFATTPVNTFHFTSAKDARQFLTELEDAVMTLDAWVRA